jgi:hypothetical protein
MFAKWVLGFVLCQLASASGYEGKAGESFVAAHTAFFASLTP